MIRTEQELRSNTILYLANINRAYTIDAYDYLQEISKANQKIQCVVNEAYWSSCQLWAIMDMLKEDYWIKRHVDANWEKFQNSMVAAYPISGI